jgi:hypothetical protein
MAYKPKSKRTNSPVGPQGKKLLDGLTANKNIDDIRALSKISNTQSTSISNLNTEINSANQRISQISTSKQDKLTLTTVGTSGPATLNNNTLNVPNYSTGLTVNTTPITGGVSGRLLFDDAGVLGETANISWNKATNILTLNGDITYTTYNRTIASSTYPLGTLFTGTIRSISQINHSGGTNGLTIGGNGGSPIFRIWDNGNVTIQLNGTYVDAGYRLDVNGTTRLQRTLDLGSVGYAGTINLRRASDGGITSQITQTNDVTVIHNYQGSGTEFKVDNVTYFHVRGFANQYAARVMGNLTAVSGLSTALLVNNTISASANNDVLVGLDIAPTFTNGAFTGVQNYAARFGGNILFTTANRTISVATPTVTSGGGSLTIKAGDAFTSGTGGSIFINEGLGAGGPGRGSINIGTLGYTAVNLGGYITISNSGPNTGSVLQVNAGGQNGLNIYWDNLTPFMQYGLVVNRQARFVNSSSYSFSTNLIIGATVNAGYMLDVNGTARIKGNSLTLSASGLSTPPANYIAVNFDDSPNHHQNWFAINSKKDISGIGTSYDRIIFPTMGSDNSTWQFNALGTYSRIQIAARNNSVGNYLDLTNSSISLSGPWTVVSIDRSNRKLIFGDMSTDVHHLSVYDLVIKGAKPFENNYGNSNGGNVYLVGGTPSTTPAGNYGNVILAHDSTAARGNVLIGTSTNVPSAVVNVNSTTQGFLPPRMTNAQMLAIATPSEGLVVYDLTNRKLCCYDGSTWQNLF